VLAAFAALHAYWALGGSWGLATAAGPNAPRPAAGPIWATAAAQAVFAYAAMVAARAAAEPPLAARVGLWILAAGAAIVAGLNVVMGTRPAERFGVAPFAAAVAMLAGYAASRPRTARAK